MRIAAGALMLMASACMTPAQSEEAVPEHGSSPGFRCEARKGQNLVGQAASAELGARALKLTGARTIRWIRPGDIVTSMSGQTIEVLNTDAEGRLVLADALWYCQERFKPRFIVDLATLTGAIIISLGNDYAGLFSNDDALSNDLLAASAAEGEPIWRMPMPPAYDKQIDSPAADIKNIAAPGAGGGSILAALFLQRFVRDGLPWAHLDIAGVTWRKKSDHPSYPEGASGFGVRLLNRLVADRYEA